MRYRFGAYMLDSDRFALFRNDDRLEIQPKAFDVLWYLVDADGRTVTKDELLDSVWEGVTVQEAALTQAVRQARRALGDRDSDGVIQTVRGRGYQIGVPVERELVAHAEAERAREAAAAREAHPGRESRPPSPDGKRWRLVVASIAVMFGALLWLARPFPLTPFEPPPMPRRPDELRSLVVLPFEVLGREDELGYLADGLTEEIIHVLAKRGDLRVVSRTSAFAYRGRHVDVREIGQELGVEHVVEGSLRRAGDHLRATAQLIGVADGFHLWSQEFESSLEDVRAVQDEIAEAIGRELGLQVGPRTRGARPTTDFETYHLFLQARTARRQRSSDALTRAEELYERALDRDASFAPAWAGLAHTRLLLFELHGTEPRDGPTLTAGRQALERAVALDPEGEAVLPIRANYTVVQEVDFAGAERLYRRALELYPDNFVVREKYGYLLLLMGRIQEARLQLERARDLDPQSPLATRNLGRCLLYAGEAEEALRYLWRALELNPSSSLSPYLMWVAYLELGRLDEAAELATRLFPVPARPALRLGHRLFGAPAVTRAILAWRSAMAGGARCPGDPYVAAQMFAYVRDEAAMFDCLREAIPVGPPQPLKLNPLFGPWRDDPRYRAILVEAGLD